MCIWYIYSVQCLNNKLKTNTNQPWAMWKKTFEWRGKPLFILVSTVLYKYVTMESPFFVPWIKVEPLNREDVIQSSGKNCSSVQVSGDISKYKDEYWVGETRLKTIKEVKAVGDWQWLSNRFKSDSISHRDTPCSPTLVTSQSSPLNIQVWSQELLLLLVL